MGYFGKDARRRLTLEDILFSQGFGTRRACADLVARGEVRVYGEICRNSAADFAVEGLQFDVSGQSWRYHVNAYLMLHKPAGTECSQRPSAWPSVYSLLPDPLRMRPRRGAAPGVQAVGRLDQDTTGLLLLTDDGQFLHRLGSPRHLVPKVYEVRTAEPVDPRLVERLLSGVEVEGEQHPLRAAACEQAGPFALRLTLGEGKYHQVKRMVAAAGNHVAGLHRSRIGQLALPEDLAPGQWRWLGTLEVEGLR
jgi:16S rRNA pseudouridine516 synthase